MRLLLNLVDFVYRAQDPENRGRHLLSRILFAMVTKFEALKEYIPKRIQQVRKSWHPASSSCFNCPACSLLTCSLCFRSCVIACCICAPRAKACLLHAGAQHSPPSPELRNLRSLFSLCRADEDPQEDTIKEIKALMYTMVFGLKTVAWCNTNARVAYVSRSL